MRVVLIDMGRVLRSDRKVIHPLIYKVLTMIPFVLEL